METLYKVLAVVVLIAGIFYAGVAWESHSNAKAREKEIAAQVEKFKRGVITEAKESKDKNDKLVDDLQQNAAQLVIDKTDLQSKLDKQFARNKEKNNGKPNLSQSDFGCIDPSVYRFDVGTVGLFNAAASSVMPATTAASGIDAASEADSTIGIKELAAYQLNLVGLYKDLAKRHDSLVDYVEQKQKVQPNDISSKR